MYNNNYHNQQLIFRVRKNNKIIHLIIKLFSRRLWILYLITVLITNQEHQTMFMIWTSVYFLPSRKTFSKLILCLIWFAVLQSFSKCSQVDHLNTIWTCINRKCCLRAFRDFQSLFYSFMITKTYLFVKIVLHHVVSFELRL